jgi:hypothetical protein
VKNWLSCAAFLGPFVVLWALLPFDTYAQIDIRNDGGYVGRARDILDCRGGLTCFVDAGVAYLRSPASGGGSGTTPAGLCGDGGSALGWDGGAYYCADVVKPGSCSAGQVVTAISASGVPTCSYVGTTAGWLFASLAAKQTTNVSREDHIKFDTVLDSSGSLVTLDTATTYTSQNNVASIGRFTLTGGHSYRLEYLIGSASITNFIVVGFANADTGAPIGSVGVINTGSTQFMQPVQATFSPGSNTRVEVRIFNNGGGIASFGLKCSDDSNVCQKDAGDLNLNPTVTVMVLN